MNYELDNIREQLLIGLEMQIMIGKVNHAISVEKSSTSWTISRNIQSDHFKSQHFNNKFDEKIDGEDNIAWRENRWGFEVFDLYNETPCHFIWILWTIQK